MTDLSVLAKWVRTLPMIAGLLLTIPPAGAGTLETMNFEDSGFGSTAMPLGTASGMQKWSEVLARHAAQAADGDPRLVRWRQFVESLRGLQPADQLAMVNRTINRMPYHADSEIGLPGNTWSTPAEFFDRGGECRDFAVAKYLTLRALGWPDRDLRLVIVSDLVHHQAHAVLTVRLRGMQQVLDNQADDIHTASELHQYLPAFSMNAELWWVHQRGPARGSDALF